MQQSSPANAKRRKPFKVICFCIILLVFFWISSIAILFRDEIFPSNDSDQTLSSSQQVYSAPPSNLISLKPKLDGKIHLQLNVEDQNNGCPAPHTALIGILTTTSELNTIRRTYLRGLYNKLNNNNLTDPSHRIDFIWFFGAGDREEKDVQLSLELQMHPNDTVVTERIEHRDDGKILDWFQVARNRSFVPHPTRRGVYCQKYLFVGKSGCRGDRSLYLGRQFTDTIHEGKTKISGMHGMLYLMSLDIIEWIVHSPIPLANVKGIEDQQAGYWMQISNIAFDRVTMTSLQLHDRPDAPGHVYWQHLITEETIVVHRCKEIPVFFRCLANLFVEDEDQIELIKPTHRLLKSLPKASKHASELGLHFTPPQLQTTLQKISHSLIKTRNPSPSLTSMPFSCKNTKRFGSQLETRLRRVEREHAKFSLLDIENQRVAFLVEARLNELGVFVGGGASGGGGAAGSGLVWRLVDLVKSPTGASDLLLPSTAAAAAARKRKKGHQVSLGDVPVSRTPQELDDLILKFAQQQQQQHQNTTELDAFVTEIRRLLVKYQGKPVATGSQQHQQQQPQRKEFDHLMIHAALSLKYTELGLDGIGIPEKDTDFLVKRLLDLSRSSNNNGQHASKILTRDEVSNAVIKSAVKQTYKTFGLKLSETKIKSVSAELMKRKIGSTSVGGGSKRKGSCLEDMIGLIVKQRAVELKVVPLPSESKMEDIVGVLRMVLTQETENRYSKGFDALLK
ncbi:hypothetical protein BDR26DRAFT_857279 [Obelidium mucronatum]|nr:hypothetical protein BDR26DRAFT_857279 [Obelidium mucronatum]